MVQSKSGDGSDQISMVRLLVREKGNISRPPSNIRSFIIHSCVVSFLLAFNYLSSITARFVRVLQTFSNGQRIFNDGRTTPSIKMGSVSNGETLNGSAKAAHVNVMTDTIIASLPTEGLRSVLRGLLGVDTNVTPAFHALVANYLDKTRPASIPALFHDSVGLKTTPELYEIQRRYRCLMGCGQGFDSLNVLRQVVLQTQELTFNASTLEDRELMDVLAVIDSDLVQALTAVRKELLTSAGVRPMNETELRAMENLRSVLVACKRRAESNSCEFVFERGLSRLDKVDGRMSTSVVHVRIPNQRFVSKPTTLETITLGQATVPRMFMGLWQFSSPAWGTASKPKINAHFRKHVDAGFVAYGMSNLLAYSYNPMKKERSDPLTRFDRHGGPLWRC